MNLCACGCGTEIANNRTYVIGHHSKGIPMSEEQKKKISETLMGNIPWNKGKKTGKPAWNTGKKMDKPPWNKGKKMDTPSPLKGKHPTKETKEKMSISRTGKKASEETKEKISVSHTGKKKSEEHIRNVSKANTGKRRTEEQRRNISAGHQGISYEDWESYARESPYCPKFNEACRESNREKYGRVCFICGKPEEDNGSRLSVHHVDMRKSQGCDSNWKLVPLCKSCHATSHNNELTARLEYLIEDAL